MLILLRATPKANGKPLLTPAESPSLTTMWFDSSSFISTKRKLANSAAVKISDKRIGPVFNTPDPSPSTTVAFYTTSAFVTRAIAMSPSATVSGLASYDFSGLRIYEPALKIQNQTIELFVPNPSVSQAVGTSTSPVGLFTKGDSGEPGAKFEVKGWEVIFVSLVDEVSFTNSAAQPVSFSVQ